MTGYRTAHAALHAWQAHRQRKTTREDDRMTEAQITREYHEAKHEFGFAMAEAIVAHPEWESLPQDVRDAKASVECREAAGRLRDAVTAFDEMKLAREERWIEAHEYMKNLRENWAQ